MVEGLFLDGIDLQRRGRCVSQTVELPSLIHANETETRLAFADMAMARAEIAVHAAGGAGLPPEAFVESFRLLKYFQFLHGDCRLGKFTQDSLPDLDYTPVREGTISRRVRFGHDGVRLPTRGNARIAHAHAT